MNDCVNAEIRDQLPDFVHDRLSAGARTIVLAHVESCADCRDELQLLRDARAMLSRGIPRVDVAYVVGALPKAPAPRVVRLEPGARPLSRSRSRWSDWRIAAAVTLLIAGGGSYAVMQSGHAPSATDTTIVATGTTPSSANDSVWLATVDAGSTVSDDDQPAAMGNMDARLGDLNEAQLNTLLDDMDNLRAEPASEPETVSIRGDVKASLEEM